MTQFIKMLGIHFRASLKARVEKDSDEENSQSDDPNNEFGENSVYDFVSQMSLTVQPSKRKHDEYSKFCNTNRLPSEKKLK